MEINKLDNPAWYSLSETHKDFAVEHSGVKFYQPDYCPFGGLLDLNKTGTGIEEYASMTENFFIVGTKPVLSDKVVLMNELVCNQMVLKKNISIKAAEPITELRTERHKTDLFELVNLIQPGYFKIKTSDLGSYYGIYKEGRLIAVAGERMKMNGYTELSAIITHPKHTGRGYAKQLIAHAVDKVQLEGNIPYLHVAHNNAGAIGLYEKLGFSTRREISFWNIARMK